jgi:hypothetical protein
VCKVGRGFPRHMQRTYLMGKSPLGRPRVAYTLQLYNYLFRFYLIISIYIKGATALLYSLRIAIR